MKIKPNPNIVSNIGKEYHVILAAHTWFSRNFLPRVAAIMDVGMISDVLKIENENTYTRSTYAGNVYATIESVDLIQILQFISVTLMLVKLTVVMQKL